MLFVAWGNQQKALQNTVLMVPLLDSFVVTELPLRDGPLSLGGITRYGTHSPRV